MTLAQYELADARRVLEREPPLTGRWIAAMAIIARHQAEIAAHAERYQATKP
jgi:hypothetical protein